MQQFNQPTLIKKAPQLLNQTIHRLFDDEAPTRQVQLLFPQPKSQRRLFLDRVIRDQWTVFFQLMPKTAEGYPVNVYGRAKQLSADRFLISSKNTVYVVTFDQIRYIANL
ncbi:hypothetical protein [Limosilactobacillus kribbianus]|uniref:hypothetical protein n=1 Tax=Limosilactobacillus kribbianus TaxID=2982695 RepID=UPI0022652F2E|nr:hypothetical protein [Limosilactobacillus kribbianus]